MANFQDLDRLAEAVRATLPDRKALSRLEAVKQSGFVQVKWHSHEIVVKLTGEAFELKGRNLLLTAVSRLLTSALLLRMKMDAVLSSVIESLQQAENLAATDQKKSLALLASVKAPLRRLGGDNAK